MKKVIVPLLVLNIAFSSAVFLRQRLKRSSSTHSSNNQKTIVIENYTFQQILDHYNVENNQQWDQRFWASRTFYETGGPAFLLITGEWTADALSDFDKPWVSYAKKLNAICFLLEHRFYGESWPGNENIHHLSTSQALADIANFISQSAEKFKLPKDTKWIIFGCSYAGMLAAWARLKYPHLVHGAVASSAPLLSKTDYHEYEEIVEKSLQSYDPKCVESITNAVQQINSFVDDTENVINNLKIFHFCDDQEKDTTSIAKILLLDMMDILNNAVQFNDVTTINISTICDIMINHNGTKLEAFAQVRQLYSKSLEDYETDNFADLSYAYQICSELGGFSSYNKTKSLSILTLFNPIEIGIKKTCGGFFGPNFGVDELNKKTNHANLLYGGLDFNVGNTLFTHGSIDPWHTSGIYETKNGSLYETIFINGTSHCTDYNSPTDQDIPELREAREETLKIIEKWLRT